MKLDKAIFLGVDRTIIETKSGEKRPTTVDDWKIKTGILPRLKSYYNKGYHIILVSNQSDVKLGDITRESVETRLSKIVQDIEDYINGAINYGYSDSKFNYHSKPYPGFAYDFALRLALNLRESIMVGNSDEDNDFAKNAYIGTYYQVDDFIREEI